MSYRFIHLLKYIIIALLASHATELISQSTNPPGNITNSLDYNNYNKNTEQKTPDTADIETSTLADFNNKRSYVDTLFDDFEKYNISRTFHDGALTLGNNGSAAQRIIYRPRDHIYTDMGFHQYDIYRKSLMEIPIISTTRTFNDLYFVPLGGSENFVVGAKFAQPFDNEVYLSIDYNRINQDGFYLAQQTKATQLGLSVYKNGAKNRHQIVLSLAVNNFNEENNGGVTITDIGADVNLYSDTFNSSQIRSQRTSVPVTSSSSPGMTRHQNFAYGIDNYFHLDSGRYKLHHHIDYEHGYYRYGDEDTESLQDSTLYLSYINDVRGIRFLQKYNRINNVVDIGLKIKAFSVKVGLQYNFLSTNNTFATEQYHDLTLFSKAQVKLKKISQLIGEAHIGIGENVGNIKLYPRLLITPTSDLTIEGRVNILRYDPSLIQRSAYVNQTSIYNMSFDKTNEFVIGGSLEHKKANVKIDISSGVIDKPVYFGNDALPIQSDNTEYLQATVTHQFFWKFIGLDNSVAYQQFSDNIYRVPQVYSIHKLYVQGHLFKKRLLGQFGVLYYHYTYDGNLKYQPVVGQFYHTDETIRQYYYTELFANAKVDRFRIFIKMDNFTDLIIREPHFQIVDYPQFDSKLRFGIRWQLFD